MNRHVLTMLIREAIHDVAGPKIDLKNPEFWYQDIVDPIHNKLIRWIKKNIKRNMAEIDWDIDWPYPVSPQALKQYGDGTSFIEVNAQINHQTFDDSHVGWDIEGGAMDLGHTGGIEILVNIDPSRDFNKLIDDIDIDLLDIVAHEIHHLTQGGAQERLNCPIFLNVTSDSFKSYFMQCDERPAFIIGFRARARKLGQSVEQTMKEYLMNYVNTGNITQQEMQEILNDWLDHKFK